MNKLEPHTILKRANGITIELGSATEIKVIVNGKSDCYHEHTLAVLDVFARPISVHSALAKINIIGSQDWIDLTATITKLYQAGVLVDETQSKIYHNIKPDSFDSSSIHISMLNDRVRTESFLNAINEVVKAGDVVLDIGTGTGVLAVAAARAGANKVYAIEAGEISDIAQSVFETNEVDEKISVIRGWSTQVELPESVDVIISEIIGNHPFDERVLQSMMDARKRFLKPDGRFIPTKVKTFGLPVNIPTKVISHFEVTKLSIQNWKTWYDIDFTPLRKINDDSTSNHIFVNSHKAATWQTLGEPICFAEIDFRTFQETTISQSVTARASKGGLLNGVLIFFELELGSVTVTTNPHVASPSNHWLNPVWFFQSPRTVDMDDEFEIQYNYNKNGKRNEVRLLEK